MKAAILESLRSSLLECDNTRVTACCVQMYTGRQCTWHCSGSLCEFNLLSSVIQCERTLLAIQRGEERLRRFTRWSCWCTRPLTTRGMDLALTDAAKLLSVTLLIVLKWLRNAFLPSASWQLGLQLHPCTADTVQADPCVRCWPVSSRTCFSSCFSQ